MWAARGPLLQRAPSVVPAVMIRHYRDPVMLGPLLPAFLLVFVNLLKECRVVDFPHEQINGTDSLLSMQGSTITATTNMLHQ